VILPARSIRRLILKKGTLALSFRITQVHSQVSSQAIHNSQTVVNNFIFGVVELGFIFWFVRSRLTLPIVALEITDYIFVRQHYIS
jgi:hypothetical protein